MRPLRNTTDPSYPLERLFGRVLTPFEQFFRRAAAASAVLAGSTVLALLLANVGLADTLGHFWEQRAGFSFGGAWRFDLTLHGWVNEGLMALFFLLVGLELKREVLVGELSQPSDALLPVIAAVGGMAVPAAIYVLFNPSPPTLAGWGIPMATDIAFAVGILGLLGSRVPSGVVVFLTAFAIADDLGAVLVIALFYSGALDGRAIAAALLVLAVLFLLNRSGVRSRWPYALLGGLLWYAVLQSGVHATLSGILLALAIPVRPAYSPAMFDARVTQLTSMFRGHAEDPSTPSDVLTSPDMATIAASFERLAQAVQSPLQRTEHALYPWVMFVVLPLFAFANAGIDFRGTNLIEVTTHPITLGIFFGLVFGKFIGIAAFTWAAVRAGVAGLPRGVGWRHLLGAAWLGGIGFTMSLFVSQLAFADGGHQELAKVGILLASLAAALIGSAWLALRR